MTAVRSGDRLVLTLAAALLAGGAVLPPAAYLLLSQRHLAGGLEAEAEVVAHEVNDLVTSNPDLWRFEQIRLEELLQRRLHPAGPEVRRVRDGAGRVVVESADPLAPPLVRRTAPVLDAGEVVGQVEVVRSLRPAAERAGLLALLLLPLAGAAFLLLRRHLARAAQARLGLEERLRQAARLEAIGRLAGGVAHDFNNLLAAVLGYARELRDELPREAPTQEIVSELLAVSQRGVQVTRSLLAFSRQQPLDLRRGDLGDLVRGLERLLRGTLGAGLELRLELDAAPLPVRLDVVQLEMVLVNLAANARDAMAPGGHLRVGTSRVELDRDEAEALGLRLAGPYARLAVADSGAGMDERTRLRVFDPFFTTKEVGRGTGLGLSLAHGVVRQHGGVIQVASAPGRGTTITLLLPLSGPRPADEAPAGGAGEALGGDEVVLLVEDDRHVRRAVRRVLQQAGYTVLEARDGDEAVRRFGERREAVRLLVLDSALPGRSGPEALAEIERLAPGIPALFVTGNPAGEGGPLEAGPDRHQVLVKPVEPEVLLRAVRRALDG